ncbi:HNH endonuclease [Halomonas sp. BLK-85]
MSNKNKRQKRKVGMRRSWSWDAWQRIEAHQHKIGAKARDKKIARQLETVRDDGWDAYDSAVEAEGELNLERPEPDVSENYLWVYEPGDLDEMSVDEVIEVWENREHFCGSKEAAAEALAIIEAASGVVDSYHGWQDYINRAEIAELNAPFLPDGSEESYVKIVDRNALTIFQVLELSNEELESAWKNRPTSFFSIEAACQALALLRQKAGVVNSSAWQALINHDEIEKLKDDLPYVGSASSLDNSKFDKKSLESIALDEKKRRKSVSVVREGQQDFRQQVLNNYYGSCCISGSRIRTVLEAAHINPYTGHHSNRLDNGLCLRVDIHRLFDNFLLSIDPEKREVKISQKIKNDSEYRHLDGKQVMKGKVLASDYFLSQHYRTFCKRET